MTRAPLGRAHRADGLELLERALGYTRGALAEVADAHLTRPTPCRRWSLAALLTHMDDALDAFTEGAAGHVVLCPSAPAAVRVASLQGKACGLLGAWSSSVADVVEVGGQPVDVAVVSHTAALEIAVHGWDVAQATGRRTPLPGGLAARLLPVARLLVSDLDRPGRFVAPLPEPPCPAPGEPRRDDAVTSGDRLLRFLGRCPTT